MSKEKKTNLVKEGQGIVEKQRELSRLEREASKATDKLVKAMEWNIDFTLHHVTLESGEDRTYITVSKGMPRDAHIAITRGKDNNVKIVAIPKDKKAIAKKDSVLTDNQEAYNANLDRWHKTVTKEARSRLAIALDTVAGFDELVAIVAILERQKAIKASEMFFA